MQKQFFKEGCKIGKRNPDTWPEICLRRKQSLELSQDPHLDRLSLKAKDLTEQEAEASREVATNGNPPPIKKGWIFACWGIALFIASFAALCVSLEPFRWGIWTYIISLGAAIATTVVVHLFLTHLEKKDTIKLRISAVFLAMVLILHFAFGIQRVMILKRKAEYASQDSVIVKDASQTTPDSPQTGNNQFYRFMFIALPLLGILFELGAGMSIHAAIEIIYHDGRIARQRLALIRRQMMGVTSEFKYRQNLPRIYEEEFSAGARQAVTEIDQTQDSQANWITIALVIILLLCIAAAFAVADESSSNKTNVLILLDLSKSRDRKGYDGQSDFEKDNASIVQLLGAIPAGSRVTIIGITQNSFASPYILLDAQIASDPGYLDEYLIAARRKLVAAWKQNSQRLKPTSETTDLFGAVAVASQLRKSNSRTVLIILSDMQQDDNENFDFDKAKTISPNYVTKAEKQGLIAQLRGMEVFCLGATAGQKSLLYWKSLQEFWKEYFKKTGAYLKTFSISRDFQFESLGGAR